MSLLKCHFRKKTIFETLCSVLRCGNVICMVQITALHLVATQRDV